MENQEEFPPLILADMRLVYGGYLSGGLSPAQRKLKKQFDAQPDRFMARLEVLERRWAQREQARFRAEAERKPEKVEVAEAVDEGTASARGALEEFLRAL